MKNLLLLILLLINYPTFSQPWSSGYTRGPGGIPTSYPVITRAQDGTVFGITSANNSGFSLFRLDGNGTILWHERINMPAQIIIPFSLVVLNDNSVAIVIDENSGNEFYVVKVDFSGNILWTGSYDFTLGQSG